MLKCKFYSYCEGFRVFWIFTLYSKSGRKSANLANKYGYYNDFIEYRCKFCTLRTMQINLINKKESNKERRGDTKLAQVSPRPLSLRSQIQKYLPTMDFLKY